MKHETTQAGAPASAERNSGDGKTGDEPMTGAQRSYLETLSREAGEEVDDTLTTTEASKRIDDLRGLSPRMAGDRSNDVDPDSARSQVDRDDTSHEH